MKSNHKKRKHRPPARRDSHPLAHSQAPTFLDHHDAFFHPESTEDKSSEPDPLNMLYIQAHETDVIHGAAATTAAQSLEVVEYHTSPGGVDVVRKIGSALIQWGDGASASQLPLTDVDDDSVHHTRKDANSEVWVDRYDARLLLDALPANQPYEPGPSSPTGWSDLSSDAEDTFFFTPNEVEDFHREKRRRLLEHTREERLKARMEEDGDDENPVEEDIWGGSDEEPDDVQKELMKRTASHLLSSPNPAQLEMRILANHGGDRRFSFLRGRWKNFWSLSKAKARLEKEKEAEKTAGLGVLAGYGSDDNDSDQEANDRGQGPVSEARPAEEKPHVHEEIPEGGDDAAKEARRKRLKEWAEKRRAAKGGDQAQSGESAGP